MRLITGVKNPTEELTVHILFTLVVGYFAFAQYDVKSPIGALTRATSPFHRGSLLPGGVRTGDFNTKPLYTVFLCGFDRTPQKK